MLVPAMAAFFRRSTGCDPATTEELALQTLAEAFHAVADGRYDPNQAPFITFLYGVAHNIRLRHGKSRSTSRAAVFSDLRHDLHRTIAEEAAQDPEHELPLDQLDAMRACLFSAGGSSELSPEERFVVIGRSNGRTFQELADQIGRSLDTVYRMQLRAMKKLRACMKLKGYS
jgi:RNA polymerase sigma factor (sigma-70 family)